VLSDMRDIVFYWDFSRGRKRQTKLVKGKWLDSLCWRQHLCTFYATHWNSGVGGLLLNPCGDFWEKKKKKVKAGNAANILLMSLHSI